MIDSSGHDISRYYGGTKPVNGLDPHECRKSARALCKWAKGQPWAVRMNIMIAVKQLRLMARHDRPALREVAMRSLARIQP